MPNNLAIAKLSTSSVLNAYDQRIDQLVKSILKNPDIAISRDIAIALLDLLMAVKTDVQRADIYIQAEIIKRAETRIDALLNKD